MSKQKRLIMITGLLLSGLIISCNTGKKGRYERCPAFGKAPAAVESHVLKHA